MTALAQIRTIVIVMMENRSFDHVVGHLRHPLYGNRLDIDGLKNPAGTNAYNNPFAGVTYKPFATGDTLLNGDPPHSRKRTARQLHVVNGKAKMDGFVRAFGEDTQKPVGPHPAPMAFLKPAAVPTCDFFATEYLVCNRWHAPLPAGTQPNRSMAYTGTTLVDTNIKGIIPYKQFIFDWLTKHGVRWRVYHSGLSFFLLFGRFQDAMGPRFRSILRLPGDFKKQPTNKSAQVVFVEPEYDDSPVHFGFTPNDDHPPLAMGPGEVFLNQVYSAVTQNPDRWKHTMFIVTFDEHGGFYDHVAPPRIRLQPPAGAKYKKAFTWMGVRVPAFVISPWVPRGGTSNDLFDHTSILQLLAAKFAGNERAFSPSVNWRADRGVANLANVLSLAAPRVNVPPPPATPIVVMSPVHGGMKPAPTENQRAFAVAARECLRADPQRAARVFPELALLPAAVGAPRAPRRGRKRRYPIEKRPSRRRARRSTRQR